MCKDGYVCVSVERSHMQVIPCCDLSSRVFAFLVLFKRDLCCLVSFIRLMDKLFLSARDWSSRVFSILVSSNLTLCCLALFFRIRSLLFLPRRDLSSRAFSLLALHSANPEPYP